LFRRFLGGSEGGAAGGSDEAETESVRRIAAKLDRLEPEQARYLAAFAYVLARVAYADLVLDERETRAMEETVSGLGELEPDLAQLVCSIACDQSDRLGGTENYIVTREFRRISTREQRARLLECLFALAAADGEISTSESHEVLAIAEELGFTRPEALGVRAAFREHLAEFKSRPR
jgi:uncharacterized tellurite resistance protein B-like protein